MFDVGASRRAGENGRVSLPRRPDPRPVVAGRMPLRVSLVIGLAVALLGSLWAIADGSASAGPSRPSPSPSAPAVAAPAGPAIATSLPVVQLMAAPPADPCADPGVQHALAAGDDNGAVAAFGGGAAFRAAVVAGTAPCIDLGDPARLWMVVNKLRPLNPVRYAPASLGEPALVADDTAGPVRADVVAALNELSSAAQNAGVGAIGLGSGYRSYDMQVSTYSGQIATYGQAQGDALSARPGHSEHQTGLAADVVSCAGGCGDIDSFGGTSAGAWVADNAWQHGFIVRYVAGQTPITGYDPEPWHLRYVGTQLAQAYHDGGFASLEAFFGLPAAPAYAG